jgi:phosphoglycerol transferase MdoB-like AlkP superfamily enzyme
MRQRLKLFGYFALFWIGFQVIIRSIFLLYNNDLSSHLTVNEIIGSFTHGLQMDVSISGYFLMLTGIVLTVSFFIQSRWLYLGLNTITITLLVISSIIAIVDLELYRHWGFRLDTTPLFYMAGAESEALGSVDVSVVIKLSLILTALAVISIFIYSLWLSPSLAALQPEPQKRKSAIILLILSGLMFIPIRGSFSVASMNTGFVYFHKTKSYANHAAINVVWNFLYSLQKGGQDEYPEDFFDKTLAESYFKSLYTIHYTTTRLFDTQRPNVILFILESFTANVIEPLGGVKGLTPNLNALCAEGILLDNFYASGDRTDKGLVAILSGYPAQPVTNIIKYPNKTQKLPSLNRHMRDLGYHTSFVYGGDIDFGNFRSYLTNAMFDNFTTDDDFDGDLNQSKWGVHDHIVFQKAFQECDSAKSPFFKVILSLSSHEPFDVPMDPYIEGKDPESLFLNSVHYTDRCIGEFVSNAKKSSWWANTLVVFVADHGHRLPGNLQLSEKARFRIPLLLAGGVIKKDSVVHTVAGQTDLANTLLAQISKPSEEFKFSRDIFSQEVSPLATYFYNNGYGFITDKAYIIYDNTGKQFVNSEGATEETLNLSKAYQQILFSDYNGK